MKERAISKWVWAIAWFYLLMSCVVAFLALWFLYDEPAETFARAAKAFGGAKFPDSERDKAAFELAKIFVQAQLGLLTTLLLAAGAYLVVTHAKNRNDRLQTSLARFRLVTELNQEIRTVYNSPSVYGAVPPPLAATLSNKGPGNPPATHKLASSVERLGDILEQRRSGGLFSRPLSGPFTPLADSLAKLAEAIKQTRAPDRPQAIPLISVLDRKTTWLADCSRDWNHAHGERTVRFASHSESFSIQAEVGTVVLHDYVHWFRRLRLGVDADILDWSDVDMYWRYLVNFARGRRFSFMCAIFGSDMRDYAFLIGHLIIWEAANGRSSILDYIAQETDPDPLLWAELREEARQLVRQKRNYK